MKIQLSKPYFAMTSKFIYCNLYQTSRAIQAYAVPSLDHPYRSKGFPQGQKHGHPNPSLWTMLYQFKYAWWAASDIHLENSGWELWSSSPSHLWKIAARQMVCFSQNFLLLYIIVPNPVSRFAVMPLTDGIFGRKTSTSTMRWPIDPCWEGSTGSTSRWACWKCTNHHDVSPVKFNAHLLWLLIIEVIYPNEEFPTSAIVKITFGWCILCYMFSS